MMYEVTITETLKTKVFLEADSSEEAEEIVSDGWRKSEYILTAEDFVGVSFKARKRLHNGR